MRTTLKSASLWLLLALFSHNKAGAQFRIDSWTTDNGLPQVSINDILQTRDGFLWLTTFGGLVRYDGLRFQVFNTGNTEGLKTSRLLHLYEDKEGALWITTERQGLTRYSGGVFKTFSREDGLPNNLFHISEGKDGNLLLVSYEGNNAAFRLVGGKVLPLVPGAGQDILSRTSRGNWSCRDGHLRKFADGHLTVDFATGFQISRCYEDSHGQLWTAGAEKGVYVFRDGQLTPVLGNYPQQRVDAITEDRDGRMWFAASQSGLVSLESGKYTAYSIADGLAGDVIQLIYQDREGTIWVGTTAGLSRLTKRVVTSYSVESGLAAENVYPIYEDRAGKNLDWFVDGTDCLRKQCLSKCGKTLRVRRHPHYFPHGRPRREFVDRKVGRHRADNKRAG